MNPREGARGFYDVAVPRGSFYTHAADWYLAVLKALNVPIHQNFDWLPERRAISAEVKRKWAADSARWIVIQPGARWLNKRWPVENFYESSAPTRRRALLNFVLPSLAQRGRQGSWRGHRASRSEALPRSHRKNFAAGNG